jgi:glycosyltransferase involved in cell wall biosynthesis
VGLALARVKQARFVWDVRDITWRYAKEVVGTSWQVALGTRALEAYMLRVLRRADLLVGATPGVSQVLVESGVEPDKVVTVFNGISEDLLGISQKKVVGSVVQRRPVAAFVGLIGYNQGLGVVLDVARALPGVDFVLAGDGPDLPLLKRRAEKLGVKNVRFMGWLHKKEQLMSLYEESDIFFTHLKSTPTLDSTSISFKLFEYMATGRPFVYAGRGLAVNLLNEIDCAVTVPPEDPRAMSSAISALLQNPERMNDLGRRGRAFVERNFRRDRLMDDLVRTLIARFP